MRIAIPIAGGRLAQHFGHCEQFALFDVDPETQMVRGMEALPAPPHQPGLLPAWLAEQGADVIVAGGMGQRAQALFAQASIKVVIGAPDAAPEEIVDRYCRGELASGPNPCDH